MMDLVPLSAAKVHLKIESEDADEDVREKLIMAEAVIIDYIKRPNHGWTEDTVPGAVKASILLMLGQLYKDRENATISQAIKNLLMRSRDPALA